MSTAAKTIFSVAKTENVTSKLKKYKTNYNIKKIKSIDTGDREKRD